MSTKGMTHIGPNGPGPCKADKEPCPFDDGSHFDTPEEAQAEYERRLSESKGSTKTLKKNKEKKLSSKEKELRSKNAELVTQMIDLRSQQGDVTYEDANPERAERRLKEAVAYAESRGNEHLVKKLSSARVLPSGAFKTADKKRVNTDAQLKRKIMLNHIDAERKQIEKAINKSLSENPPKEEKFTAKNATGSYSLTVKEGVDRDEFDNLSPQLQKACSSERESLSLDEARQNLPASKVHEITQKSQVLDFVIGKEPDVGQSELKADTNLKGKTGDEKAQSGIDNVANFYSEVHSKHGKVRDQKADLASGNEAIKTVASKQQGNTFAPARSQKNGALVTERLTVNKKKAEEMLSKDELKKITVKKSEPDPEKAKVALSADKFNKIFKAKKASIRVTEAKG